MANEEHVEIVKRGKEAIVTFREYNPFVEFNLSGANLSGADLSGVKLSDAHLTNANLIDANLIDAKLNGARLRTAKLRGAKLSEANLSWAKLSGTNFEEAHLRATIFANVDMSTANGLAEVGHYGPSSIGIDTLYRSKGKIPDVFLRGCGVPEDFITFIPSLTANPIEFYSCFISYNSQDKSFARRLHNDLQFRGIRCWLDEKHLLPGDDIHGKIDEGIRLWDKVLLCASEPALTESWWVDSEIEKAFEKERTLQKQRQKKVLALIPLDLDGHLLSQECQYAKKTDLTSRVAANFQGWEQNIDKYEQEFEKVVQALRTDDFREPPPEPKL